MANPETTREAIRSAVVDAVQSADRAAELCSCKSEDRLVESLTDFLAERIDSPEALKADITRLYQMNVDSTNEIERLRAVIAGIGVQQNVKLIWKLCEDALK